MGLGIIFGDIVSSGGGEGGEESGGGGGEMGSKKIKIKKKTWSREMGAGFIYIVRHIGEGIWLEFFHQSSFKKKCLSFLGAEP